jgi:hypothetical protein
MMTNRDMEAMMIPSPAAHRSIPKAKGKRGKAKGERLIQRMDI